MNSGGRFSLLVVQFLLIAYILNMLGVICPMTVLITMKVSNYVTACSSIFYFNSKVIVVIAVVMYYWSLAVLSLCWMLNQLSTDPSN